MEKSPEAFRTISEVAEALDTPAHVLRFWESRFPQIRPVKRAGGRRYYRPSDVALLTGIKILLHDEGLTIRGVQKILREQGLRHVAALAGEGIILDAEAQEVAPAPVLEPEAATILAFEPAARSEPAPEAAPAPGPEPELAAESPADFAAEAEPPLALLPDPDPAEAPEVAPAPEPEPAAESPPVPAAGAEPPLALLPDPGPAQVPAEAPAPGPEPEPEPAAESPSVAATETEPPLPVLPDLGLAALAQALHDLPRPLPLPLQTALALQARRLASLRSAILSRPAGR